MRAKEFIREESVVKINKKPHKSAEYAMPAAHRVAGTADRHYDLYRIQMYAASSDGKNMPEVDKESWVGKNNTAHPYTNLEGEMLKHAYKIAGIEWDDALKPNPTQKSMENPDIKKTSISPVVPFKGYK